MNEDLIHVGGKTYKRCRIVMLPTEKATKIGTDIRGDSYPKLLHYDKDDWQYVRSTLDGFRRNFNLYFLSDEEIKENDYLMLKVDNLLGKKGDVIQFLYDENNRATIKRSNNTEHTFECSINFQKESNYSKIITSTDESLKAESELDAYYRNGIGGAKCLPRPSDDFLKVYSLCNGEIEEVLVEVILKNQQLDVRSGQVEDNVFDWIYKLKVADDNTISIKPTSKGIEYWKKNAEGDYISTPISVLRYISELEKSI